MLLLFPVRRSVPEKPGSEVLLSQPGTPSEAKQWLTGPLARFEMILILML